MSLALVVVYDAQRGRKLSANVILQLYLVYSGSLEVFLSEYADRSEICIHLHPFKEAACCERSGTEGMPHIWLEPARKASVRRSQQRLESVRGPHLNPVISDL